MITNRSSVLAAAVLAASSMAYAQVGPELMLKPFSKDATFDGSAAATYFFESDTDFDLGDGQIEAQLSRYAAQARYRVLKDHKADPRLGFSISHLAIDSDEDVLPKGFTDVQIGLGTGIAEFDNGWVAGLTLGVGWAGANEFGDSDAYYGAATLLVGGKLDEHSTLGLALDYNGNRTIFPDIPLIGVVYTRQIPEQNLEVSLGFPFAYGRWRPIEPLLLEVNFTFPDFVGARVSYDLVKGVGLFASLAKRTDAWHSKDLDNDIDRIFFEQTGFEIGARFSIDDQFVVLIAGGYAFAQEFRYGFDSRDTDEITEIDDGAFARIEGQFSF